LAVELVFITQSGRCGTQSGRGRKEEKGGLLLGFYRSVIVFHAEEQRTQRRIYGTGSGSTIRL
jgi:hypothetical protein